MLPAPGTVVSVGVAASVQFAGEAGFQFRVISVDPAPTYAGWCWLWGYVLHNGRAVTRRSIFVQIAGLNPARTVRAGVGPGTGAAVIRGGERV